MTTQHKCGYYNFYLIIANFNNELVLASWFYRTLTFSCYVGLKYILWKASKKSITEIFSHPHSQDVCQSVRLGPERKCEITFNLCECLTVLVPEILLKVSI